MLSCILHKCLLYPVEKNAGLFVLCKKMLYSRSVYHKKVPSTKGSAIFWNEKGAKKRCPREKNTKKIENLAKKLDVCESLVYP